MDLLFVIPGWYLNRDTIDSEKKDMIRVIGGGTKSPNHFKLSDGREMHENEILDKYIFTPTAMNEQGMGSGMIPNVDFGDLDTELSSEDNDIDIHRNNVDELIEEAIDTTYIRKPVHIQSEAKTDITYQHQTSPIKEPTKSEDDIFVDKLLSNIQIDSHDSVKITLPIKFAFNYDLNKLKTLLFTMDTDIKTKHKFIDKLITENVNVQIRQAILEYLSDTEIETKQESKINDIVITENEKSDMSISNEIESEPVATVNKYLANF